MILIIFVRSIKMYERRWRIKNDGLSYVTNESQTLKREPKRRS